MDWNAYIDLYCERTGPGWWGEPLNAASNLAFWIAAWMVWRAAGHRGLGFDASVRTALGLLVFVGAASFAFHTQANRWSAIFDTAAIALYLHVYLVCYLRRIASLAWRWAWLGAPAFAALAWLFAAGWALTGWKPTSYLAAWSVLLLLVADSGLHQRRALWPLLGASLAFAVSLSLRQLDLPLCSQWRWGTHFVWHILNAVTLGLTAWALATAPLPAQRGFSKKM